MEFDFQVLSWVFLARVLLRVWVCGFLFSGAPPWPGVGATLWDCLNLSLRRLGDSPVHRGASRACCGWKVLITNSDVYQLQNYPGYPFLLEGVLEVCFC